MKTPILDALVLMMEKVVKSKLPFFMENTYEDRTVAERNFEYSETQIHNCGTAACIAGYAAFDKDVCFAADLGYLDTPVRCSNFLWEALDNEIGEEFSNSVFSSTPEVRKLQAETACKNLSLTTGWLDEYPHLSADENTDEAEHALEYMKKLQSVLRVSCQSLKTRKTKIS